MLVPVCFALLATSLAQYIPQQNYNVKGIYDVHDYLNKFPYNYRYPNEALPKQVLPDYPQGFTGAFQSGQAAGPTQYQPSSPYYGHPVYQPSYPGLQSYQGLQNYQGVYQQPQGVYQQPQGVYQQHQGVYQQPHFQPPPPPPAPSNTSPPPPPQLHFKGRFTGTCNDAEDGLYYVDHRSFAYCSNSNKAMQNCAEGSANPQLEDFQSGKYTKVTDFCSINIAAEEISSYH